MPSTPWAILLCRFRDDLTEPQPRAFYEDLFTASGRGQENLVDFFDDYSLGRVDLGSSRVFGWFTLAQQRSEYKGSGVNPVGRSELVGWARSAATASGVTLAQYVGTVVCMNVSTDLWGGGGAVCCDPGSMQLSILAQEVGHGFGLDHSRFEGSEADYSDHWDVMSTWNACFMASHPRWTLVGPGLNAANMHGRGWLDSRMKVLTPVAVPKGKSWVRDVELRPLHRADLSGFLAAQVTDRFGGGQLFFEFRTKERWDAAIPRPAVLAHRFAYNHSYLVPADSGRADLLKGDAITVYPYGDRTSLRIEVTEIDAAQRRARLLVTETPPSRPRRVGGRRVSHGVQVDGGGWVIVDGHPIPVPPRSPMAAVLHQVALHERSHVATDPRVRDSGQREALQAIREHMSKLIERQRQPTSPAPRVRPKPKKTKGPKRAQVRKTKPTPKKRAPRR